MHGLETETRLFERLSALQERVTVLEAEAERARQMVQAAERRFQVMADAAPVMMWLSDAETHCTFVSKRWLDFRGRRLDEELGSGWTDGVHPDDLKYCMTTFLRAFQARQDFRLEYRLLRGDGTYVWVADCGAPRREPDGEFAGYVGSVMEIAAPQTRPLPEAAVPSNGNPLTPRERQVLKLIAEGKSTKAVAATLGISYKTADSHRTKIMEKLRVHETPSLVRYAIRVGLIVA